MFDIAVFVYAVVYVLLELLWRLEFKVAFTENVVQLDDSLDGVINFFVVLFLPVSAVVCWMLYFRNKAF